MNDQGMMPQPANTVGARTTVGALAAGVIGVLLCLLFVGAGVLKLFDLPKFADSYAKASQPRWVFFGSGVVELVAGAALLVPRFRLYAAWALLGMIFVVCWQPWTVHELFFLLPQSAAITLLVLLVWLSRSREHLAERGVNATRKDHI